MKLYLHTLLILMVITSCENGTPKNLSDHTWEVTAINGTNLKGPLPWISFNIIEGKLNGNAGCNSFFGNFELNDNQITFGPLGATRMMCPDMTNEDLLFQNLEVVTSFSFDDNTLLLNSEDRTTVIKCQIKP